MKSFEGFQEVYLVLKSQIYNEIFIFLKNPNIVKKIQFFRHAVMKN